MIPYRLFSSITGSGVRLRLPYASAFVVPPSCHRRLSVLSSGDDHHHHSEQDGSTSPTKNSGSDPDGQILTRFEGKVVPLGRGDFVVRRILPFVRQRSVGPFVFLDHFGPVALRDHAMDVGPHPHIGLMTITYLYQGAILHRDSTGAEQLVIPGEVNGMIAGRGVTHSERGTLPDIQPHLNALGLEPPTGSHGLQIWMALSKEGEEVEASFHHGPAVKINDYATLVVGQANQVQQSAIHIDPHLSRVAYVDIHFPRVNNTCDIYDVGGGDTSTSHTDNSLELGVYASTGKVEFATGWGQLEGESLEAGNMVVVKVPEASHFRATIHAMEDDTRVAILGGTPLPEKRHMFWNFLATTKEKVEAAAEAWERLDRTVFPKVVNEANQDSTPLPKPGSKK